MSKTVHRYEVPVDDQWHQFVLTGPILHVNCRKEGAVEFWATATGSNPASVSLRVYGTGHDVPDEAHYVGTAFSPAIIAEPFSTPAGRFVWHLFEADGQTGSE